MARTVAIIGVVTVTMLGLASPALADPMEPDAGRPTSQARKPNICFGGLSDRRLIPHDEQIHNPFRQTTLLGCMVDGGEPAFMPELQPMFGDGKLA